jgi:hypothetical protein
LDIFDLARVFWPAFVIAPLTLRTLGTWSWAAWLPPRLRAIENRRALAFVEKLVGIVAAEKESKAPAAVDERALREEFIEAADGIARVLPEAEQELTRAAVQPVSDRLRVIATKALERALANGLRGSAGELARRDRLARACLEILRKLPSAPADDVGDGEHKIYRAR